MSPPKPLLIGLNRVISALIKPSGGIAALTKVLVISDGSDATGILIEALDAVREFAVDSVQPPPVATSGLAGVFPEGDTLVTLIEFELPPGKLELPALKSARTMSLGGQGR